MKFDLHMHSCFSKDGELTPKQLIQKAKENQLEVIALCDHDSVQGVLEMISEGEKENIQVIPGIECSTLISDNECHLLGYNIDTSHPYFQNLTEHISELMHNALHQRILKFEKKYNINIDEKKIIEDAGDNDPWFALCYSIFSDPSNQNIEDFQDYLKGGKRSDPAPCNFFWDKCQAGSDLYVRVEYPSFKESVRMIHEAGGIAVLAHPFKNFYKKESLLQEALDAGIDGIEVYSNYHDSNHIKYYNEFAKKHNLIISCGSDFHGKNKPNIQMGKYGLDIDGNPILTNFLKKIT